VIEACPGLKVIARAGVGWDAVDVAAATAAGVVVTFAPGTNHDAVAEHTFMLLLALAKNLIPQDSQLRAGGWPRKANVPLREQTLGLVGLGRIGKAVALLGFAFGMRVVAHEPYPDWAFVGEHGVKIVSLDEVFREADYLSLHAPYTVQGRHLVNARTLGLMKPTAFLVNTARGGLVNEPDLIGALRSRRIAGAGLDVFEDEPPPADHPFRHMDNVVLTAHMAGVDLKSRDAMAHLAARAITAIHRGEWPAEWIVNPEVKPHFRLE
jgi:phosphoglycerate dehydrogenase-like enzyme